MKGKVTRKRFFIAGIILVLLASFIGIYFKSTTRTSNNPGTSEDLANLYRYGDGGTYVGSVKIDDKYYTQYTWDSFMLDSSGINNGSKYIYMHDLNSSDYPNLYCVKEGTSTAYEYTTVDGEENPFILSGSKITNENYAQFYNLLASTYVWRTGDSNSINEFVKKVNPKYDAENLRSTLSNNFWLQDGALQYFVDSNSGKTYDILEVFIKDIQQTVIWDFTEYGDKHTRENIVLYLRTYGYGSLNSSNDTLIGFAKDCYDYVWESQNTDVSKLKDIKKDQYTLSVAEDKVQDGLYNRDNVIQAANGTIIGPIKVNNEGQFNITYDVVVNGETFSGNDVKVSDSQTKGSSNSATMNGDIYLWVNTKIGEEASTITINGNVDFGEIPDITFLKSDYGQNLVDVVKRKDSTNISTTLKIGNAKEFDLRLTVNIDEVFSKSGAVREVVPEEDDRDENSQLGYRPMVRENTLERNNVTTEDYSTNKVPVKVMNGDVVKYHVKISNEGELDGKAKVTTVYVPAGLDMLSPDELEQYNIEDENYASFNWNESNHLTSMYAGKNYKKCVTEYGNNDTLTKYDKSKNEIDYEDLYIYCKVDDDVGRNEVLQIMAEITEDEVDEGEEKDRPDRDSTPNNEYNKIQGEESLEGTWRGNSNNPFVTDDSLSIHSDQIYSGKEDDDDFESVIVDKFDLALTKQITKVSDGKESETTYERLKNIETSALNDGANDAKYIMSKPTVKVRKDAIITYKITVYNESGIDGYAKEITDYIPKGLTVCDSDGSVENKGSVTCTGDDEETYTWEVSTDEDGNQTAVCKNLADKVISGYEGDELYSQCVYITCKADGDANPDEVYINIAEITKYGYYIDKDTFVETSTEGIDRDSVQDTLKNGDTRKNQEDKVKQHMNDAEDKSTYQNQDDDDFESVTIISSQVDMALRVYISELDGKTDAKMETQSGQMDVTLNDEGSAMEGRPEDTRNNREPKTGKESYERGIGNHKSAQYYHSKQAILAGVNKEVDYTVEIYNEGKSQDLSGIASEVTIDIPKGLTFKGFKDGTQSEDTYYSSSNNDTAYKATVTENDGGSSKLVVQIPDSLKKKLDGDSDGNSIGENDVLDPGNTLECDEALNGNRDHKELTDILVSDDEKGNIQKFTIKCDVDADADGYLTCIAEITDMYAYGKGDGTSDKSVVYKHDKDTDTYRNGENVVTEKDSTPNSVDLTKEGISGEGEETYKKWYFNRVNITYIKDSYIANDYSNSPNEEDDTDFETVLVQAPVKVNITKTDEAGKPLTGANLQVNFLPSASAFVVAPSTTTWNTNEGNQEPAGSENGEPQKTTDEVMMRKVEGARAVYKITETVTPSGKRNVLKDKMITVTVLYTGGKFLVKHEVVPFLPSLPVANVSEYYTVEPRIENAEGTGSQSGTEGEPNYYINGVVNIDIKVKNPDLDGEYSLDILKKSGNRVVPGIGFTITKNGTEIKADTEEKNTEGTSTEQAQEGISGTKTDEDGFIYCYSKITAPTTDTYKITEVPDKDLNYVQLAKPLNLSVTTCHKEQQGCEDCYDVQEVKLSVEGDDESESVTINRSQINPTNPSNSLDQGISPMQYIKNVALEDGKTTDIAICLHYTDHMHIELIVNNPLKEGVYELFLQKYSTNNRNKLLTGAKFEVKEYLDCTEQKKLTDKSHTDKEYDTSNIEELIYSYSPFETTTQQGTLIDTVTYKEEEENKTYYDYYLIKEKQAPAGYKVPEFFTEKITDDSGKEHESYLIIEVHKESSKGVGKAMVGRGYIDDENNQIVFCEGEGEDKDQGKEVLSGAYKDVTLKYGEDEVVKVFISDLDIRESNNPEFDAFISVKVFDPEETQITAEKVWEVEDPQNYQVKFKLQKMNEEGTWVDVKDKETQQTVTTNYVTGNGTATMGNLAKYSEEGKEESYRLVEDESTMQRREGEGWVDIKSEEFINNRKDNETKQKLSDVVQIGDRIAYDAASRGEYSYQVDGSLTGNYRSTTYKSTDDMSWQVLDVDKEKGTVSIMAVNPTESKLTLKGSKGYRNSVLVLDEISKVYGYGRGAQSARSINLDDIKKYSNFNEKNYSNLNGKSYNSTTSYKAGSFVGDDLEYQDGTSQTAVKVTQTAYWYIGKNNILWKRAYDAIFRNGNNTADKGYWLASREAYLSKDVCGYYVGCINEGNVDGANLYISDNRTFEKTFGVVPVVTLQADIRTAGQDENGNWTLIYDDLTVNTPMTSISKTKKWEGVDNEDNYRATFALYKVVKDDSTEVSTIVDGEKLHLVEGQETKTVGSNRKEKEEVKGEEVEGSVAAGDDGEAGDVEEGEIECNDTATWDNLKATELINGKYSNIEYRVLEISAEYFNTDTGKWNYLVEGVDYTQSEDTDKKTITNTVSIKTSISVTKEWYVGIPENYRAEYELYTLAEGAVEGDNGENLTKVPGVENIVVQGNATGTFENLPKYDENKKVINYRTKEVKIEKTTDGTTWETVPMENFYRSKKEVEAKTERLADKVSVGDYIAYDAASGGEYTYKAPTVLTGSPEQEVFSSSDINTWRVIDVDKDKKQVYIMAETPTKQQVTLSGKAGYVNEKTVLDSIANVYAHGYGAVGARSITIDDIMQYFDKYEKSKYTNLYGIKNGQTVKYNYGRFIDDKYKEETASTAKPIDVTQSAYWFVADRYYDEAYIYNALFRNPDDTENVSYWVASPTVYTNKEVAGFYSNIVNDGYLDGGLLYASNGEEYTKSMPTVPVVVLSETVNTDGQDARGVWTISSGTVYNEKYINQERTEVPVKKVWNVDVLNNYKAKFRLKQTINGKTTYVKKESTDEKNTEVRELKDIEGAKVVDQESKDEVSQGDGDSTEESGGSTGQEGSDTPNKDEDYYVIEITGDGEGTFKNLPAYIGRTRIEYIPEEFAVETTKDGGTTWESVDKSKFLMEDNVVRDMSNLAKVVHIGDYVDYDASSGESASYTTDAYMTGSTETSTFKSTDKMRWRVLSNFGGTVKLIADKPTETKLTLSGKRGYWNAETVLNDAASVYGHGKGSVNASSVSIGDINHQSIYKPENYTNIHGFKYGSDHAYDEGTFLKEDGTEQSASHTGEVTMNESAYWYFTQKYFPDERTYELLFGSDYGDGYKQYWVAGNGVYLNEEKAGFYVNQVRENTVDGAKMFSSDKDVNSYSVGIVPIVYLQANAFTTGQDENGVWNLTVNDDFDTPFINSEITEVTAKKNWSALKPGYEYRAEFKVYQPVDKRLGNEDDPDIIEIGDEKYAPVRDVEPQYITKAVPDTETAPGTEGETNPEAGGETDPESSGGSEGESSDATEEDSSGGTESESSGEDESGDSAEPMAAAETEPGSQGDASGEPGTENQDGIETEEPEVTEGGTVTFKNLKKYLSTTLVKYKVIETKVQSRPISSKDEESPDEGNEGSPDEGNEESPDEGNEETPDEAEWTDLEEGVDYTVSYDYDKNEITNSFVGEIDINVNKVWNIDNPNKYQAVIYLQRTMKDENGQNKTEYVYDEDGNIMSVTIVGNETKKFENLPVTIDGKTVTYTVTEPEFSSLLGGDIDKQNVRTDITYEKNKDGSQTAKVVNTWLRKVKRTKRWIVPATDNINNYRVTFTLYSVGKDGALSKVDGCEDVVVIGNGNVEFTGVPAYNGTELIKYVIQETKVEHLDSETNQWIELKENEWTILEEIEDNPENTDPEDSTDETEDSSGSSTESGSDSDTEDSSDSGAESGADSGAEESNDSGTDNNTTTDSGDSTGGNTNSNTETNTQTDSENVDTP